MDFSNFKFRCSSLGYIMADPKGKSNADKFNEAFEAAKKLYFEMEDMNKETKKYEQAQEKLSKLNLKMDQLRPIKDRPFLSDTCKTHLCDVYTSSKYGRTEDVKSKYLEKGTLMEEDAITLYSLYSGEFYQKNRERRYNDFIEGEMDFEGQDIVIDTKVNWSIFQFTRTAAKPIKPLYHWQLDGYMWLWNKPKGRLVYALIDTPEHLIKLEEKRLLYDFVGSENDYEEACNEIRKNHNYSDIPNEERVRIFDVYYQEERIEKIKSRVKECRNYLNNLNNKNIDDEDETEDSQ